MVDVDATTTAVAGRHESLRDALLGPPGWLLAAVAAVPLAAILWASSFPGGHFLGWFFGIIGVVAVLLVWVIRVMVAVVASSRAKGASGTGYLRTTSTVTWRGAGAVAVPVMLAATAVLVVADLPLQLRFRLSRSAFDAAVATELAAATPRNTEVQSIGSYRIRWSERVGDGILFTSADGGFIDTVGFAYLPDGPIEDREAMEVGLESPEFHELGDGWYWWTASW